MQLFVRSDFARTLVVRISDNASVAEVEAACVNKQTWLQEGDWYLSYGGVPLRAHMKVEDYAIQSNATLDRRLRVRGGCFAFSITLWIAIFLCFALSLCTCGLSLPVAFALIPLALILPLCCL